MNRIFLLTAAIILAISCTMCEKEKVDTPTVPGVEQGSLKLLKEIQLNISEPSGLSFGPSKNTLLIVSDNTNRVYETDLLGNISRTLAYTGNDLEGVTYNAKENIVAVAEERKREVVLIDYNSGNEISRHKINVAVGSENKGLEGISFSDNNKAYYIVNEDLPGQMIVWNTGFDIISKTDLNFAGDYSAIFVDVKNANIWFVSDESQFLYKCDYNAKVLKEYVLPSTKFEGLAIDVENQIAYLVNDATAELKIFKIE